MAESPRIIAVEWGRMEVEGLPPGKDFKLYNKLAETRPAGGLFHSTC
ncbi:hypothetical protein JIG36_34765 [Actinoplanes sp. LDG1-06]|uniref:Uncharacterized protein n=1 Tax=Paractinoplanes ovalisporus TaxID=2810368 RepID=A0ABS2AN71_9ACTN|nr:hypothetical protein [Actinoplanes ovalisporus]MBM2620676.1 hypothetical protein [Actinoplanes ovalisporus]